MCARTGLWEPQGGNALGRPGPPQDLHVGRLSMQRRRLRLLGLRRVDRIPISLHVCDRPTTRPRLVQRFVETPDVRISIVGPFTVSVSMMNDRAKSTALTGSGPLQHLEVAVGIAKCGDWPAADELVNP